MYKSVTPFSSTKPWVAIIGKTWAKTTCIVLLMLTLLLCACEDTNMLMMTIAPPNNPYAKRLHRMVTEHLTRDGYVFSFKVYLTQTANACAMADGTIRVNSGLMDVLNDSELLFVLGHEMGHVVEKHSRKK